MKDKPILFSAPMVLAILAGEKTQTRRAVKWPDWLDADDYDFAASSLCRNGWVKRYSDRRKFAIGHTVGARLWCRETFRLVETLRGNAVEYKATDTYRCVSYPSTDWHEDMQPDGTDTPDYEAEPIEGVPWKPSIFMPRWASRITLEVTGVRVERLNDISVDDAIAEGIERGANYFGKGGFENPVDAYRELWESINGKESWAANPWVFVYTFKRVAP